MTKPRRRAVLYLRLSASDDASTSISRQEADLQELATREGWDVVRVLVDDGISGRKVRANADEALRMIRDGEADALAVWKLDRWTRQGLAAVGNLVDTLDVAPGALFVALRDGLRSDQPAWRIIASVLAEVARMEADNTALRVKSSRKHLTHNGRYPGGAVPFGYRTAPAPDGGPGRVLEIDPREAAIVREVTARILADESLTSICRDLFERKIPTAKSPARKATQAGVAADDLETGTWRISTIRITWTSEHLLGYVKHHGTTVTGPDGLPAAVWPPILDYSTMTRLKDRLGNPRARSGDAPRRRAARLLSGLLYCAYCDKKMHVRATTANGIYGCSSGAAPGSCPVPRISAAPLENYITERFLAVLGDAPEVVPVDVVTDPGTASELAQVENALQELSSALLDDEADVQALMGQLSALKARRSELRARPAAVETILQPTGKTYREAWNASEDLDEKRRLLTLAIDHIQVSMRESRGPQFEPQRVAVHWIS